jgi:hypothetical protein
MRVYLAETGYDYEGAQHQAIFSTKEAGESWIEKLRERGYTFDWSTVIPYAVNDPEWDNFS